MLEEDKVMKINKDQFLEKYKEHQEWLENNSKGKRLFWNFEIDFKFEFSFILNLSSADLSSANLSSADLDHSSWGLSCKTKEVKLCKKLQAQLLGHVMNVSPDVNYSKEQVQFVKDNWPRFEEFCNDKIKGLL